MRPLVATIALTVAATACAGERPLLTDEPAPPASTAPASAAASSSTTTSTTPPPPPVATTPDGRAHPVVPEDPAAIAARLTRAEQQLRSMAPTDGGFADIAHEQQMIYRRLGRDTAAVPEVLSLIAPELAATVEAHVAARAAIGRIRGDEPPPENVPAWEIIEPLPADELRAIYDEAEAATGIDWSYLAAINLLETGYGRIVGLSTAGARGPMQFLPTTWEEVGEGSIDDPEDAIPAAARYLVRRGGPDDMEAALWGYNNSDAYVQAVSTYAELFRADEAVFVQTHGWEIHYSAAIGDLWFPVGYRREEPVPASEHVAEAPWSITGATVGESTPPPPDG